MRFISILSLTTCLATGAFAQDRPNTILVLDASGSMWGQIDGVAKITSAQEVVTNLLSDFPADQGLGLTVYGHRQRGDCSDIETIVAPGAGTAPDIMAAVAAIKPLGKTPMTDAVIAAAEALRYTEDSATVILVSDGVETCNPDPCAAARLLEEAGIDFTAHVIGFDITDPEALRQMQCIADETGGRFLTAANAAELDLAMASMVQEPDPIIVTGTFEARLGDDAGPLITDQIIWDIRSDSAPVANDIAGNPITLDLSEGPHTATAYRIIDEVEGMVDFTISGPNDATVVVVFPDVAPTATLDATETAPLGATIPVTWTGPNGNNDYIAIAEPGARSYVNYAYTANGSPLDLMMPPEAGTYEIRYFDQTRREVIATKAIEVTPVDVTLDAPVMAIVGEDIAVTWAGPDYARDYISVAETGARSYINYTYTEQGTPLSLTMPAEPGDYEIRYQLGQGGTVLETRPITVSAAIVSLDAPAEGAAASDITVTWTGPDYARDYISIAEVGERSYINYTYTEQGNPLSLTLPAEPGDYEIRYQLSQGGEILATRPITVTPLKVSLEATDSAVAGATISVGFEGPDYPRDYIAVSEVGANGYVNYAYTSNGNPVELVMPPSPGTYELRYVLDEGKTVVARRQITVSEVKAQLVGPATVGPDDALIVGWDGPDYRRDYIAISEPGENGYIAYAYTSSGNPVELAIPDAPGNYEIRYVMDQDKRIIARMPIEVTK